MQPQFPVPGSNSVMPTPSIPGQPVSNPAMPPVMPVPAASAPAPAPPSVAPGPTVPAPAATTPMAAGNTAVPAVADDSDQLEKAWAEQAERALKDTAGDPYEQLKAFTKLKAEYLQKRYGKQLKVED